MIVMNIRQLVMQRVDLSALIKREHSQTGWLRVTSNDRTVNYRRLICHAAYNTGALISP
jgi:hypothetical protein